MKEGACEGDYGNSAKTLTARGGKLERFEEKRECRRRRERGGKGGGRGRERREKKSILLLQISLKVAIITLDEDIE
jgi:hypothetical protein